VVGSASVDSMQKNKEYSQFLIPNGLWSDLKTAGIIAQHTPVGEIA